MEIEVSVVVEGKEKWPRIVKEARKQGVAMLVLAQKKRFTWRLLMMWAGNQVAGVWWITVFRMQFAWPFL